MARKRTITPGFFRNEDLGACSPLARLLFAGMWCWADREGRLEDRPRRLRAEILPYDQADGEALVADLAAGGFVLRYEVDGRRLLQIVGFDKYQDPHPRETPSELPGPAKGEPKVDLRQAKVPPRLASPSQPSQPSSPSQPSRPACPPTPHESPVTGAEAGRQAKTGNGVDVEAYREALSQKLGRRLGGCRGEAAEKLKAEVRRLGFEAAVTAGLEVARELDRRRDPLRSVAALPGWLRTVDPGGPS